MPSPQPVVAIAAVGNPQSFAVCVLQANIFDNPTSGLLFGPGREGQGVTMIVHCCGADIWKTQLPKSISTTTTTAGAA
jgi:hypothetical protein